MRMRAGVALLALAVATACGSQVSPDAYYRAQGALGAASGSSSAAANASGVARSSAGAATGSARTPGATSARTTARGTASAGTPSGAASDTTSTGRPRGGTSSATATHPAGGRDSTAVAPSASCGPPTSSKPTVVVCPSSGLHDGQSVHVYASGFQNAKPTLVTAALVVTECADKGDNTQQGDCGSLHFVNPDKDGRVSMTIAVAKVVGSNKDVCGAKYRCLISVAQPKQPPDYEADQHIGFA